MRTSIFKLVGLFFFSLMVQSSFAQNTQNRSVGNFEEIKIGGAYQVFIKKGSSVAVRLEGSDKELEKTITEVKDGVLKVYRKKGNWGGSWSSGKSMKVYITYTQLKGLHSSGSSNIKVEGQINTTKLNLSCSGSGNMHVPLKANSLSARVSGSGDINIEGECDEESFSISGSGDIHAIDLRAKKADLRISGSGSIRLHVTDYLEGNISGSGRVRYKGDPKQKVRISGSGSVKSE